MLFVA